MKKIINLLTQSLAVLSLVLVSMSLGYGQCSPGQINVDVSYTAGGFNGENGWLLWNATAGTPTGPMASAAAGCDPNATVVYSGDGGMNPVAGTTSICVADGSSVELYLFETFGDGWCAPACIDVSVNEDGSNNGCDPLSVAAFTSCPGGPNALFSGATPENMGTPAGGVLAASFTVTGSGCAPPSCSIECPDDIVLSTDPGVCSAFVELPEPVLTGDCVASPVAFVEVGGDLGLPTYNATGLDVSTFTLNVPVDPAVCASCLSTVPSLPMEICLTADWGGATAFESSTVTVSSPSGSVTGVLGLGGVGDCNEDCITIDVPTSWLCGPGGTSVPITIELGADADVDNICGGDDPLLVSFAMPTDCDFYDIQGAIAGGNYPLGETCITYLATGSGSAIPTEQCSFKITVEDNEAPVFTCPVDQTVNLQGGECCQLIDYAVNATDNCGLKAFGLEPSVTTFDGCDPSAAGGSTFDMIYFDIQNNGSNTVFLETINIPVWAGLGSGTFAWEVYITPGTSVGNETNSGAWTLAGSLPEAVYSGGDVASVPITGGFSSTACGDDGLAIGPGESLGIAAGFPIQYTGSFGIEYVFGACTPPTNADGLTLISNGATTNAFAGALLAPRGFVGNFDYSVQPANGSGSFELVSGLPSGSEFPIGTTQQCFRAEDCSGNMSECKFSVTVNEIPESTRVTSLTCNDNINVSIDENCEVFINADMFLEGTNYGCYFNCYEVYIKDERGVIISSTCSDPEKGELFPDKDRNPVDVNGCKVQLPCGEYTYEVYDACNDNLCWGTFTVEDKIAPMLQCPSSFTVNCTESTEPRATVIGVNANTPDPSPMQWSATGNGASLDYDFGPVDPECIITDVNIQIVLDHGWVPDTEATLTSPSGTTVALWGGTAGVAPCFNPNNDNVNVIFDDESGNAFACHSPAGGPDPNVTPPADCLGVAYDYAALGGSVGFGAMNSQAGDLSMFNGENCGGVWTLEIVDNFAFGQGGCLNETTLFVEGDGPGVPLLAGTLPTITDCEDNSRNQTFVYDASCGKETVRYTDNVSGSGCDGMQILRTWVATDDKGNSGECVQTITVESIGIDTEGTDWFWPDTDVPTIACLDGSSINPDGDSGIQLTCGADASPEGIMKYYLAEYQACVPPPSPDAADYPIYRANLKRFARSKAFPYAVTNEGCESDTYPEETAVIFMENTCNIIFSYNDHVLPACGSDCSGNEKIIREWTALDWCDASTITHTQIIHSKDNNGPQVDLLAAFGVQSTNEMTVSADPWGCQATFTIPAPEHLLDDCSDDITYTVSGPANLSFSNGAWQVSGAPRGVHTYTYTAVDCCGNEGTATLTVTVVDNTPPIPVVIRDVVVGMTYAPSNPEGGSAKVFVDQIDNGSHDGDCGRVKTYIRRMDGENCGNPGNNTFANFNDLPNNVQTPINHDRNDPDGGQFVKFCCADLLNDSFDGGDLDGDGINDYVIIPVEIAVWDDADGDGWPGSSLGDRLSVTWANVRLEAKVAPILTCPPDATIECDQDENSMLVIQSFLGGTATAVSNCGTLDVEYTDECDEDFNKACHHGIVIRTYTIPGTQMTCEQEITINEPGVGTTEYFSGSYYLTDANGDYILQNNGRPIENDNVTFPYEGDAVDVENDDFDDFSEVELDCVDGMLEDEPTWVAEGCGLIGWSLESDTIYLEGDACVKVINKYCVIDWCQYDPSLPGRVPTNGDMKGNEENPGKWCWTVIGKLRDEVAPSVTATDAEFPAQPGGGGSGGFPTSLNCVGTAQMSAVSNDDASDCPSDWIKWVVYVDSYDDGTPNWEWSSFIAPDDGNQIPCWTDTNGNGIPDVRVGSGTCNFDNADSNGTAPGETFTINIPETYPADCDGSTRHKVSWTAFDGCGNISSTTSYFTITDQKAPTPYCVNLSTALMDIPVGGSPEDAMVELWAIDFDRGSFDNCTDDENLLFTFTDDASTVIPEFRSAAMTFTCEDLAGGNPALLTLPIYVWDGCGNRDFCLVNLRLTDNNNACGIPTTGSTIAGVVQTEEGETVEDVEVMNEQMPNTSMLMEMTDDIGHFMFAGNDRGEDYEISASKNNDYLNGVSTIDLVKIQRHILGLELLDSPYKMIAADVNSDGAVDGRDLVELRKLILGIYTELPQNGSWRFVDATQTLDINNPWNFNEKIEVKDLSSNMMTEDFVGVKVGDVNNSAIANLATGTTEMKSGNVINIDFADVQVEAGQEVEVQVNANVTDLYGYQFTMSTPGLQLVNVTAGDLDVTEANFGVFNNVLTTSWNSTTGVNTTDNLFTMTFKSNVSGSLSEILGLNSSITSAEAYVGSNLEIVDIALNNANGTSEFALHQNEPNPFRTTTEIGFVMPETADATMTVYDVTGKVITVINGNYTKGYNTIELSKSDLGASGVLYYQLDSGDFTATKKMIIIE